MTPFPEEMVRLGPLWRTVLVLLWMAALAGGVTREDRGVTGGATREDRVVTGEGGHLVREARDLSSETMDLSREDRDLSSEDRDLSSEAMDLSSEARDLSRQSRDLSRQARDLSGCERDRPELSNLRGAPKVGGVAGRLGLTHLHIAWNIDQVLGHT